MSARSIAMQPASAIASACGGEGPASLSLSKMMWWWPVVARKRRSPCHLSVALIGGFAMLNRCQAPFFNKTLIWGQPMLEAGLSLLQQNVEKRCLAPKQHYAALPGAAERVCGRFEPAIIANSSQPSGTATSM